MDLSKYLQQNHDKLTWKERIVIAQSIIGSIWRIHNENAIYRDLHSENTVNSLYNELTVLIVKNFQKFVIE